MKSTCKLLALLLLTALLLCGCENSKKVDALTRRSPVVVLTGGDLSKEYTLNPLYAKSDSEYALGMLAAPAVMRKSAGGVWEKQLGVISVAQEDGKTVATVKLDTSLTYSNGRKISITAYTTMLETIARIGYTGYFRDFYKNPIEGLAAFRFNCEGLTLEQVPDFDAQLEALFADVTRSSYREMLIETGVAGVYTSSQNPESISPDGRSFKQLLIDESKNDAVRENNFFLSVDTGTMVSLLSDVYAAAPKTSWMIEELRVLEASLLQEKFIDSLQKAGGQACRRISGVTASVGYSPDSCTVRFTRIVPEDEAIALLNLPVIYSYTLQGNTAVVGAGKYALSEMTESPDGAAVTLKSDDKALRELTFVAGKRQTLPDTLAMGQFSLAVLQSAPTPEEEAACKAAGYLAKQVGAGWALYDPAVFSDAALTLLEALFG